MPEQTQDPAPPLSAFPAYQWPEGKQSAVLLSVDVDANSPFLWSQGDSAPQRLGTHEIRNFGPRTGLWRLVELFARFGFKASFYVPGHVAEQHPDMLPALLDAGHEIGLHGYFHEIVSEISDEEFTGAIEASLELFVKQTGKRPTGFRSPAWEMTPHMLSEVRRLGLSYDSSLSGFDHPYEIEGVTEIPVQWAVDDAIFFKFEGGGRDRFPMQSGRMVLEDWKSEWRTLHRFGGLFTLTVHDWISGRAQRIALLEDLLQEIADEPTAWVATADEIARFHQGSANQNRFAVEARIPQPIGARRFGKNA
jgi:peptidoglycan/xylan/chitin deacetylase (PgdA/CDA1 family)